MTYRIDRYNGDRLVLGDLRVNANGELMRPSVVVLTSGVNPTTPSIPDPGWVSGDIKNLAASALVDVIFDLGADWAQYMLLQITVYCAGPSSGLSGVHMTSGDSPAYSAVRRLGPANQTSFNTFYASITTAGGCQAAMARPMGRFLCVRCTNADATNATGAASSIVVAAYQS